MDYLKLSLFNSRVSVIAMMGVNQDSIQLVRYMDMLGQLRTQVHPKVINFAQWENH